MTANLTCSQPHLELCRPQALMAEVFAEGSANSGINTNSNFGVMRKPWSRHITSSKPPAAELQKHYHIIHPKSPRRSRRGLERIVGGLICESRWMCESLQSCLLISDGVEDESMITKGQRSLILVFNQSRDPSCRPPVLLERSRRQRKWRNKESFRGVGAINSQKSDRGCWRNSCTLKKKQVLI